MHTVMADQLTDILQQFLNAIANDIRPRIPVVTGATRGSIQVQVQAKGQGVFQRVSGQLTAAHWLTTFETGRPPTRAGAARGTPTLREAIEQWIEKKNFRFSKIVRRKGQQFIVILTPKQMSWMIAIKMHREGNALYRALAGGVSGVISDATTQQRIDAFTKVFGERAGNILLTEVTKNLPAA